MRTDSAAPVSGAVPWTGYSIDVRQLGAPIVVCDTAGGVVSLSPQAEALLERLGVRANGTVRQQLPASLWSQLKSSPTGQAIEWRPAEPEVRALLGCTRYALGLGHTVIFMREVSDKQAELSRRLHQQRLESTGRLVASIAHEVRTAVASILYNADFLSGALEELTSEDVSTTAEQIHSASRRLQAFVDGLLDFAKLGPPINERVSVESTVKRAIALVRPIFREKRHKLSCSVSDEARHVLGNPMSLDQILVNLLLNAAEACEPGGHVQISAELGRSPRGDVVVVSIQDDGPGVAAKDAPMIFEPFFTNRAGGTGLGLTTAREAARECGGEVSLDVGQCPGARFVVSLPSAAKEDE